MDRSEELKTLEHVVGWAWGAGSKATNSVDRMNWCHADPHLLVPFEACWFRFFLSWAWGACSKATSSVDRINWSHADPKLKVPYEACW